MDEADQYKQRLEAIAEKRRLQEEQDRVRREMEEEKLRLQQLKRKSLRDQWLMEGAPLSPTSPGSQSPHSPLWGAKAQDLEKHIDKLQAEHEHFAEEPGKLKEQMENGQTEVVSTAEGNAEGLNGIVPNGGDITGVSATEDNLKMATEDAATLTNCGGGEGDIPLPSFYDSHALSSEHPDKESEDGPDVLVSEEELHPISELATSENEEAEGTLVIRAERVIVTEEGSEAHEDPVALPGQLQVTQSEETVTSNAKEGQVVAAVEEAKTELATQGDGDNDGTKRTVENTSTDGPDTASEAAALSSVPVYGESTVNPDLSLEANAAEVLPEEPETRDPVPGEGHFQDVPLAEPQQQQVEEQEPLLSQTAAPDICSEAEAAANVTYSPAAQSPPTEGQGEDTEAPKRKSCQCCSVM